MMNKNGNLVSEKKKLGIYIHIPFCAQKCGYCDFYSAVCGDESIIKEYILAVSLHAAHISQNIQDIEQFAVDSIFFGGGTPTIIPPALIISVLNTLKQLFNIQNDCEITIESNPATVSLSSLCEYRNAGVNRLSIGMQSVNKDELISLSRRHTPKDVSVAVSDAHTAGFENISLDIMYRIPHQTLKSYKETLHAAVSERVQHISAYALKIEENTPLFFADFDSLALPDEDTEYEMFALTGDLLSRFGYPRYEISNYANLGYECRHNLKYWRGREYLGLGAAAHSYFGGQRYAYIADTEKYTKFVLSENFEKVISERNIPSATDIESEYLMMNFRLSRGISTKEYKEKFGKDFNNKYFNFLEPYIKNGYITHGNGRYSFTERGMYVSNYILSSIIEF